MVGYNPKSWSKAFSLFKKSSCPAQRHHLPAQVRVGHLSCGSNFQIPALNFHLKPLSGELYLEDCNSFSLPGKWDQRELCPGPGGSGAWDGHCYLEPEHWEKLQLKSANINSGSTSHSAHITYPRKSGETLDFRRLLVMPSLLHLISKSSLVIGEAIKIFRQNT